MANEIDKGEFKLKYSMQTVMIKKRIYPEREEIWEGHLEESQVKTRNHLKRRKHGKRNR